MGLLKCARILRATVNLVLSHRSPYLLSSYSIALHLELLSFIHILISCVCVCLCLCMCVYVVPRGSCSLMEFFSHRSVWQVALLASSVCSEQVLSWVRSCHIHLHKGTVSQSDFLNSKLPSTFFPEHFYSFTITYSQFSCSSQHDTYSTAQLVQKYSNIFKKKKKKKSKMPVPCIPERIENMLKNNWHRCMSLCWCPEDILPFTFDNKHTRTHTDTHTEAK